MVKSVSLCCNELSLKVDRSDMLIACIEPSNADNTTLNWVSSNEDVASVNSEGLVMAHCPGAAIITVTASDGSGCYDTCVVSVTETTYRI
ncbi:MAG: Ig-like domain-containing protein [Oscillospiraceae bacterium]|nr:Ig-like domain-containing protein [Oscillospiraceae bacterium]